MYYDPIKEVLNKLITKHNLFRKVFYIFLDLFILRQWYVKKAISSILTSHFPPSHSQILFYDAGAGFCQYSDYVLTKYKFIDVFAIDTKTGFLSNYADSLNPKKRNRFSYLQGDLTEFLLKKTKANIVIAIDILEHIKDDVAVLRNIYNSMNENSFLIISTPSNFCQATSDIKEHVRSGYDIKELKEKAQSVGFDFFSYLYTYGFWGNIYWQLGIRASVKIVNISRFLLFLLPFYLMIVFIPSTLFMILDFLWKNKKGNGILMILKKI